MIQPKQIVNKQAWVSLIAGQSYMVAAIAIFALLDRTPFSVPNSPLVLTTLIVFSAFQGGIGVGILSAVLAWVSAAFHFSLPGHLFHFNHPDLIRMVIMAVVYPLQAYMTGKLKDRLLAKAESEKSIREKMVAASKMTSLGEMAGGIAHEINNPLAIIKMCLGQIQELLTDQELDKVSLSRIAHTGEQAIDRTAKIISGLLSFSRDTGSDPFKEVSVPRMLDSTLSFCQYRLQSEDVQLTLEGADSPLSFIGSETEISQVILNLLNNSLDEISGKNERWISLKTLDLGKKIEIRVTDSGKGVPKDIREKMFQPFFTTKEIGKGTGLGLSVSLGIVRRHNGELKVDPNSPNTCFVLQLPKAPYACV